MKCRKKKLILSDLPLTNTLFLKHKMSAIVNKFLLARDTFMPAFTYSVSSQLKIKKE